MKITRHLWVLLVVVVAVGGLVIGCSDSDRSPTAPDTLNRQVTLLGQTNPRIYEVMAVQERHTPDLMALPEVVGTATGLDQDGNVAILVLLVSERGRSAIPASLDGTPVVPMVTGKIYAMAKPSSGVSHTAKQTPPILLGTSGGWRGDLANGYCCGGTLGSLIQVGANKRILSNYHVFEADIVAGGNGIVATTGDFIIQPGLIDVNCAAANAQNVATLVVTKSLPNNNVDCSSANIITGMVDPTGAILEIGTISSSTVAAYIGQPVKKSGRTTGLTRSTVSGLNGTVSITYEDECAGATAFTKTFTGQILVANKASKFLASGDSGSLMVEDITTNPRAVGLLFAGGSSIAIANPIDPVLTFLGATMVGN